jgi:hypothetical protein
MKCAWRTKTAPGTFFITNSQFYPLFTGINIEPAVADESQQGDAESPRSLDSEARWCADRCQYGDSRHHRFLNNFKSGAAAHENQRLVERQAVA